MATTTIERNDDDLRAGDMLCTWFGLARIIAIRPYIGPLSGIVFAVAALDRGGGISLTVGGTSRVVQS